MANKKKNEQGLGPLTKLTIESYKDRNFNSILCTYELEVNPIEYNNGMAIAYSSPTRIAEDTPSYGGYTDNELKFKFLLDGTGAVREGVVLSDELENIQKAVYNYNGDTHEPPYLKLVWGNLSYGGRLKKMDIHYTMFGPQGDALRAEVEMVILKYIDAETLEKLKHKHSPDMSHLFTIKSGQSLAQLCMEVYGSFDYVADVARVNGLDGFRKIEPGTKLLLPPLS